MAVLLDTDLLASEDRADAYREAMLLTSGSTHVELESTPTGVSSRVRLWSLGQTRIFTTASTGISMSRETRAARGASPEYVAIGVHGTGTGFHETARQRVLRTGDVMVVDITRPFDFSWSGRGSSTSLQVPLAELGTSRDVVQRATDRLERSPLYGLVSRHVMELTQHADTLSASAGAPALGEASTHLVRALLADAADEGGSGARDVMEETLLTQVRVYVRQHLRDPHLDADSVAAGLAVSRRQLFRVCARASFSLEQYIIGKRLEGARSELASTTGSSRSITSVAHAWGFKDPTHFSRRFRAAYGLLPRDWRRVAAEQATI